MIGVIEYNEPNKIKTPGPPADGRRDDIKSSNEDFIHGI